MNKLLVRNISFAAILIGLLAVIIISSDRSPFGKNESLFSVNAGDEIRRIEFSGEGSKLVLQKRDNSWMVNGTHEARKSGISFIIRVLTEISIQSPLSEEVFSKVRTENGKGPVKVKVYSDKRLLRSFYVYKTAANRYGNVMQRTLRSKPFIVSIPGFDGEIGSAFTLNELFWEPYTVFNLLPSEIASVTLENVSEPSESFMITNKHGFYNLSASGKQLAGWDTSQVKRYLSYFTWIPFEKWAFELTPEETAKIVMQDPVYRISVMKSDGSPATLVMWERADDGTGKKDTDRLWAKYGNNSILYIVRYFDIDPLLKKRSYFFAR